MSDEAEPEQTLNKESKAFAIIASLAILGIILFIIFGLKTPPPPLPSIDYNYFTFTQVEGLWQTEIDLKGQPIIATFRYNPTQVEDVVISGNKTSLGQPLYITFDPEAQKDEFKYLALASSELALNLIRGLNLTIETACTKNATDACINRTIVDCDANVSVIKLVPTPPAQITLDDNCVTLSGQGFDLLKSVDRLLYKWYKIMP